MFATRIDDVDLVVAPSAQGSDALAGLVAEVAALDEADVVIGHRCQNCGSADHGRPLVLAPAAAAQLAVSRSRAGEFEVVAASVRGPIGIDIESLDRIAAHDIAGALVHASEAAMIATLTPGARVRALAALWTMKEALAKATGDGVRVDFRAIEIVLTPEGGVLRSWPAELALTRSPRIHSFAAGDAIVGALAILGT